VGLDTIGGLPVHALVVHASVVLLPVTALGAILIALKPAWSRRFGIVVVLISVVAAIATVVSKESGEQLATHVGVPDPHAQLGDKLPLFAGCLVVVVLILWLCDRGIPANRSRPFWLVILAIVVIAVALVTSWWTIRVGDSGDRAVWEPILQKATN
jgi:magnesium-transporting ATPase (P-type)